MEIYASISPPRCRGLPRSTYCYHRRHLHENKYAELVEVIHSTKVVTAPNQKWGTDVTEFAVEVQKLYLWPIIDLYNGEIVSYALTCNPRFEMITQMLDKAFRKIDDKTGLMLHSDQGWQYQMNQYRNLLKKKGIRQSLSRKGNCLDNAMSENFFSILKSEMF